MLLFFYILVCEQILQGFYSCAQGVEWLRMARRHLAAPAAFYAPRAAVLCPVKGQEPGLEENLLALTRFDYPQYELFFAVASVDDPAYNLLQRIAASSKRTAHIVLAGRPRDCGEKVNNLRAAVEKAGAEFDVLVFADSDGRPPRRWLTRLVAPLADQRLGAATTFRWLLPQTGGFWSALASAWNASIATYLGEHKNNFCWGGGTAIRRERFEQAHVMEAWAGSVSDDYSLTRALRDGGFDIAFVPECLVPSPCEFSLRNLLEFTNRQLVITRVYQPRLWRIAAAGHLCYCLALMIGLGLWAGAWATGAPSLQILVLTMILPLFAAVRGTLRLIAAQELLPEWRPKLRGIGWAYTLLAPLVPFLYLYNTIAAAISRKITWRGTRYELISPDKTHILAR